MIRQVGFILICVLITGCGLIPGAGRLYSDYHKASYYAISGASKTRVKMDWGNPDEILKSYDLETWVYYDRQDGKTFKFNFDKKGRLVSTNIG